MMSQIQCSCGSLVGGPHSTESILSQSFNWQDKLLGVRGDVTAALDALKEGLERRQSVASAKALLELMQDVAHVMSKVRARDTQRRLACSLLGLRHRSFNFSQDAASQINSGARRTPQIQVGMSPAIPFACPRAEV